MLKECIYVQSLLQHLGCLYCLEKLALVIAENECEKHEIKFNLVVVIFVGIY